MRISAWLAPLALLGIASAGAAACSSSSSGTSPGADGGSDGGGTCSAPGACYQVDVTLGAGSSATCGAAMQTLVADYTALPADGGAFMPGGRGGCTGTLSGCKMTVDCPNGEALRVTFTGQGFSGTDSLAMQGCMATLVGTRLATCPPVDAGGSGDDGPAAQETGTPEASADAPSDAVVTGAEASVGQESGAPDGAPEASGGGDAGTEAGVADSSVDAASEAQASEAGLDAPPEAEPDAASSGDATGGDDASDAALEAAPE